MKTKQKWGWRQNKIYKIFGKCKKKNKKNNNNNKKNPDMKPCVEVKKLSQKCCNKSQICA